MNFDYGEVDELSLLIFRMSIVWQNPNSLFLYCKNLDPRPYYPFSYKVALVGIWTRSSHPPCRGREQLTLQERSFDSGMHPYHHNCIYFKLLNNVSLIWSRVCRALQKNEWVLIFFSTVCISAPACLYGTYVVSLSSKTGRFLRPEMHLNTRVAQFKSVFVCTDNNFGSDVFFKFRISKT